MDIELFVYPGTIRLHRLDAYAKFPGDVPTSVTLNNVAEHFRLADTKLLRISTWRGEIFERDHIHQGGVQKFPACCCGTQCQEQFSFAGLLQDVSGDPRS